MSVLAGLLTLSSVTASSAASGGPSLVSSQPDLINWVVGPSRVDLGEAAQIDVPAGFRFAGKGDAEILLRSRANPAPETLVGLIAPTSGGGYMVVFEYNAIGYVKTAGRDSIDSAEVLAALRDTLAKKGNSSIGSVEWLKEPKYDSSRNILEWALVAEGGSRKTVNHVIRLLGREGVLDGIAVQDSSRAGRVPLQQIMAGVSFKSGYGYADYRKGDRLAAHSLADLITSENPKTQTAAIPYVWVISGAAALLVITTGTFFLVRKPRRVPAPTRRIVPAKAEVQANTNAVYRPLAAVASANGNGNENGNGHGHARVNGERNGKHKRRMFDYQRFYSDLLFQVSDQGARPAFVQTSKVRPGKKSESRSQPAPQVSTETITACLIESQKRLIEEQQRLIREQTKLIEEKTRLIHEKNQVLDKQAELFGNNIF